MRLKAFIAITLTALIGFVVPAWGAFPVVATVGHSTEASDVTTHDAIVPASISAGNLLLMAIGFQNVGNIDPTVSGSITGWTALCFTTEASTDFSASGGFYYKFASGSETNFTYTSSASTTSVTRIWRITGAHASTPPECTASTFTDSDANSNSLTVSWGAEDNLWFSTFAKYNNNDQITAYPTNYTGNQYNGYSATGDAIQFGAATQNLNSISDNPDTYTFSGSGRGVEFTIGIRPAAVAPPSTRRRTSPMMPR